MKYLRSIIVVPLILTLLLSTIPHAEAAEVSQFEIWGDARGVGIYFRVDTYVAGFYMWNVRFRVEIKEDVRFWFDKTLATEYRDIALPLGESYFEYTQYYDIYLGKGTHRVYAIIKGEAYSVFGTVKDSFSARSPTITIRVL
jgi:hypothetical protein